METAKELLDQCNAFRVLYASDAVKKEYANPDTALTLGELAAFYADVYSCDVDAVLTMVRS